MKHLLTFAVLLLSIASYASPHKVFNKLCEVNKYWQNQNDVDQLNYPPYKYANDREWIKLHLTLVEQTLRNRSTKHLTPTQKANRLLTLDYLNEYWKSDAFPVNDKYGYRTPIFIDDYDNFCAVGYLVKATGHETASRKIATQTNLAYVHEMEHPELFAWAKEYGFTVDELAWIQPTYPIAPIAVPIGKGTNGTVHKLFANRTDDKLYVGGDFNTIDSTISANNIAYVTESNGKYTWHNMGDGVNGKVYAITEFDGKIFVAGQFDKAGDQNVNNIAYWDGGSWYSAGCIWGTIKDLAIYNNELYAAGDFDVCASAADINFAKWNGANRWIPLPGLSGHINTMEVLDSTFHLGGEFTFMSDDLFSITWNRINGFKKLSNKLKNEAKSLTLFHDTVYVGCAQKDTLSSDSLIYKLVGNTWKSIGNLGNKSTPKTKMSYNSILGINDTLHVGGHFDHVTLGYSIQNYYSMKSNRYYIPDENFNFDDAVHSITFFKGYIYAGGAFKYAYDLNGQPTLKVNSISVKKSPRLSIENTSNQSLKVNIHPNPTHSDKRITVTNNFHATSFILVNINGQKVYTTQLSQEKESIVLPDIPSGTYIVELQNNKGITFTEKLVLQ